MNPVSSSARSDAIAAKESSIVSVEGLSVQYGSRVVLQNIDFSLQPGDFAAFIGPNGGGKTTLFRALLGITGIRAGRVVLCGQGPAKGRESVGYVPQSNVYDPRFPLRVKELVAMGCLGPGLRRVYSRKEERVRIAAALETVGMIDRAGDSIRELSGGQLQRVFIARGLVSSPRLLILDEPVTHLDPGVSAKFYELLRRLNQQQLTILMSTHDPVAARHCGNRLFEINGGVRELTNDETRS